MLIKIFYCLLLVSIINCDVRNEQKLRENGERLDDCVKNPLQCQGLGLAKNIVNSVSAAKPNEDISLGDGIDIVPSTDKSNVLAAGARSMLPGETVPSEDGVLNTIQNYLTGHEIRFKLNGLLPTSEGMKSSFSSSLLEGLTSGIESARGKKDKGGGILLVMAMMMGKMMMTMGFGGIGLLTMKALMVSALALMLSTILGIKKLASSGHEESGHQVIYAGHHDGHHRKRRSTFDNQIPLPYRGWVEYIKQLQ